MLFTTTALLYNNNLSIPFKNNLRLYLCCFIYMEHKNYALSLIQEISPFTTCPAVHINLSTLKWS